MSIDIIVPSIGESISEATIATWHKKNNDLVEKNEVILELESNKASVEVVAVEAGKLTIIANEGNTVSIGQVIASIDTSVKVEKKKPTNNNKEKIIKEVIEPKEQKKQDTENNEQKKLEEENCTRVKMTPLRKTISNLLKKSQQETASLTTFNEVDMSNIIKLRTELKESFKEKYQVKLGFMSFFSKAVCLALKEFPIINAKIDKDDIVYYDYVNLGIAISSPKGLVVPNIKNAQQLNLAQIEQAIIDFAVKAKDFKLSLDDLSNGTFTITNGGIFGSMLSTPIINYGQSAILGMHNIVEKAVVVDSKVVIRPMMYLALSYDHQIIDGRESVSFLCKVKQYLEQPTSLIC